MADEHSLFEAVTKGDVERLTAIAAGGANVNAEYYYGGPTALMKAAERGNAACIPALIAAGADVNAKDNDGATVLRLAHRRVRGILRAAGAKRKISKTDFLLV